MLAPGATPPNWLIAIKLGVRNWPGVLGLCTKFHYDPISILEVIAKIRYADPRSYLPKNVKLDET